MMKLLVLSALLALAVALPKKVPVALVRNALKSHPHIINGKEAEPHSIPYQVWISIQVGDEGWLCGGSLISSKYVLTAGHCVDGGQSANVTLGAHNINEKEDTQVIIASKRLILHEKYDGDNILNDIGLIELETEVTENDAIKIGVLSNDANNTFEGETGKVSGWGLTDGFDDEVSPVLMWEEDEIISNKECQSYFGDVVRDANICLSADSGRGACNGDSGGPLTVEGKIVGIVSFGAWFCLPGNPSAFTRTTSFLQWIQDNSDVVV